MGEYEKRRDNPAYRFGGIFTWFSATVMVTFMVIADWVASKHWLYLTPIVFWAVLFCFYLESRRFRKKQKGSGEGK